MLENIMNKKAMSFKAKMTIKACVSAGIIALAVLLPQIVHLFAGAQGGVRWLPMYLPVLIGGCLLGPVWGLGIGLLSPLVSFTVNFAMGNAMPAATRLPFMMAELAVFAVVSGAFSDKIAKNSWMAFPAVLLASVSGRALFMLLALIFDFATPFTAAVIWNQIQTGLLALILQAVIVPFIVMGLEKLIDRDNAEQQNN